MADNVTVLTKRTPAQPHELHVHAPGEDGWLTPAEVAALTPEIVRERIRALKPMIAAHAAESEGWAIRTPMYGRRSGPPASSITSYRKSTVAASSGRRTSS